MASVLQSTSTEEQALENLGAIKSSYALIKLMEQQIENRILKSDEALNESPASFTNIMLENQGRILGHNFYEQMMYKNEMTPSTAIKLRSLYNKMNSETATEVFGYPASITFVLAFNYDELVEAAKQTPNYTLTLNKETRFNLEDQEVFVIDHNIDIKVTNPGSKNENVYAIFDTSDKLNPNSTLTVVNNRLVKHQVMRSETGEKVFAMFIPTRQMSRSEVTVEVTSDNPDFFINYTDQLYGFELNYRKSGNNNFTYIMGLADGNAAADGYNFSVDTNIKRIYFTFNRTPDYWRPEVGDTIKIKLYTTKGSAGNFTIPNIYSQYNSIFFDFRQDRNEKAQDLVTHLMPYLSIKDTAATGGRDEMDFEAVRKHVIYRGSNSSILTPNELERYAENKGFSVEKIRHDIRCLEFRGSGILKNGSDIISSIMSTISFNLDDLPLNREVNNRTLSPKSIYNYTGSICNYLANKSTFEDYYQDYIDGKGTQYMFPFHIRFNNKSTVETTVFDMNIRDLVLPMNFIYFNNETANESSIQNLIVTRNPITEDISELPDAVSNRYTTGFYHFSFYVFTSENVIQNILNEEDTPVMKYKMVISDSEKSYMIDTYFTKDDVDDDNNAILIHAYLKTDDAITDDNKIMARDYALRPIPFVTNPIEFYFLNRVVDVTIYCVEKNLDGKSITTAYDSVLTESEKADLYYVSTVYNITGLELFKNMNDMFNFPSELIINQKEYQRYEADVYDTYSSDVYLKDSNGRYVTEFKTVNVNGTEMNISVTKILHKKGSFKYVENIEMSQSQLINALLVLTDYTEDELKKMSINDLASMIIFDTGALSPELLAQYLNKFIGDDTYSTKEVVINGVNTNITIDSEENKVDDVKINELQEILNSYRTKVLKHAKGDVINIASLAKDVNYTALIKKVPLFNRIYAIGSGYKTILNTYDSIIEQMEDVQAHRPDGATICLGIKNTSGPGEYEIYDQVTNSWIAIDDISLSFDIGVKFNDNFVNDTEKECEIIKDCIRDYINNFEEVSFGINTIFEKVKEKVTSVDYMVLYKINQYPATKVQSIRKKNGASIVSDKMSVKQVVDTSNSNLITEEVSFKPDIIVRVIQ